MRAGNGFSNFPFIARYAFTIFIGAFLLFQIEPMIAKYLLPWFGGAPAAWTTCLLFFQVLLLAGYLHAHLLGTRLRPRVQTIVHLGLVALCIGAMLLLELWWNSPVLPGPGWKAARVEFPIVRILLILCVSIGLPYFALSATAPLLQSWFSRTHPGASPYRLYALSNLGSLVALLTYPFVVEPQLTLKTQAQVWAGLYLGFAIGITLCALPLRNAEPVRLPAEDQLGAEPPAPGAKILWLALSACASLLLYGATSQMTQVIASIPFLWILPLALYLLSFIICFDSDRWYRRGIFQPLFAAAVVSSFFVLLSVNRLGAAIGHVVLSQSSASLIVKLADVSLLLFTGCMVCNGELVRLKPDRRDLTGFYLMVSAGGALGGVLAVVVAPLVFSGFWDLRFAVWICAALMTIALIRDRESWIYQRTPAAGAAILAAALAFPFLIQIVGHGGIFAAIALVAVAAAVPTVRSRNPPRWLVQPGAVTRFSMVAAVAVLGLLYLKTVQLALRDTLWTSRTFYGVLRVTAGRAPDGSWSSYHLISGPILHGEQFFSAKYPQLRYYPTGYYGLGSGVGLVLMNDPRRADSASSPMRVGVVGLGAGALAAWGRPGDYFRFYELNPQVIKVATDPNGYFTYIRDSSAHIDIVAGDARLSMERELAEGHPQHFDVLVIDAFNGDAVPVHLLTREAMKVYLRELKPDGVLAVHISNLYLDLRPVLAEHSRALNLRYGFVHADEKDMTNWSSDWVLLARNDKILGLPAVSSHLQSRAGLRRIRAWTDNYSNLFQLLK